jgi:hypothetical protein
MGIDSHRNLLRVEDMAATLGAPALIVPDHSVERVVLGTGRSFDLFLATKVVRSATESKLGATYVQRAFGGLGIVPVVTGITLRLSVTVSNANILCTNYRYALERRSGTTNWKMTKSTVWDTRSTRKPLCRDYIIMRSKIDLQSFPRPQ